jgi:hypothetical protein
MDNQNYKLEGIFRKSKIELTDKNTITRRTALYKEKIIKKLKLSKPSDT